MAVVGVLGLRAGNNENVRAGKGRGTHTSIDLNSAGTVLLAASATTRQQAMVLPGIHVCTHRITSIYHVRSTNVRGMRQSLQTHLLPRYRVIPPVQCQTEHGARLGEWQHHTHLRGQARTGAVATAAAAATAARGCDCGCGRGCCGATAGCCGGGAQAGGGGPHVAAAQDQEVVTLCC